MHYESFFYKSVLTILTMMLISSCSKDNNPDSFQNVAYKLELSDSKYLALIKTTIDNSTPSLYSISANGQALPAQIKLAQNRDGKIIETNESITLRVGEIRNATKDYILLSGCNDGSDNGTSLSLIPKFMLVRKSDGMIYNLDDIGFEALHKLANEYECPIIDESNSLILGCYSGTQTALIDDMRLLKISPSVSSNDISFQSIGNSTFSAQSYNRLFYLQNDAIAFGSFARWGMNDLGLPFMPKILNCGGIVHDGNGSEESLGSATNIGTTYAFLSDGYISMTETSEGSKAMWTSFDDINKSEQTSEVLGEIDHPVQISSWFETDKSVLIKYYVYDQQSHYLLYDKSAKTFSDLDWSWSGYDNMELWKENLNGQKLWGLTCSGPNLIENAIWINPFTLEHGETPLNLSDIRILQIIPDYQNGQVQLIATNESNRQLIINLNLDNGNRQTFHSVPDMMVISNMIKL